MGEDGYGWSAEEFKSKVIVEIHKMSSSKMSFSVIHIPTAIANAIRRILISSVPTIAIEHCYFLNNTSIIHDEILAHRLGLIPILVDPGQFMWRKSGEEATDMNTVVMNLRVRCSSSTSEKRDPEFIYTEGNVYSSMIRWEPQGNQAERFKHRPIKAVNDDILIAKMRPGQEIDVVMHCIKGTGSVHAKWSPVAPAFYRLLPKITIKEPIRGEAAERFKRLFPPGVIAIKKDRKGVKEAVVENTWLYSMDREVLRHVEFKEKVELSHVRDHFLFSVESTGALTPQELVTEAVGILKTKCGRLREALHALRAAQNEEEEDDAEAMQDDE